MTHKKYNTWHPKIEVHATTEETNIPAVFAFKQANVQQFQHFVENDVANNLIKLLGKDKEYK